ncbi:MAG: RING finger protein, partial [Angelakisella sp.]
MSLYTGCECPCCGKPFEATDDIVVCPICGSPHHRACYKAAGHCANEQLHEQNKQWERPVTAPDQGEQPAVRCGNCGVENPPNSIFCNSCGHALANDTIPGQAEQPRQQQVRQQPQQQPPSVANAVNPCPDFTQPVDFSQILEKGVTVKDAADYVGPGSYAFILRFREMT